MNDEDRISKERTVKKRVYLETTIVSYLAARPSRDLIIAAHQELTREWWNERRDRFGLYISQFVLDEAGGGDVEAAQRRVALLAGVPKVPITDEAISLAGAVIHQDVIPPNAAGDALHVAVATVHQIDILLTWNCRHLANAEILGPLGICLRSLGFDPPIICTPAELMGA